MNKPVNLKKDCVKEVKEEIKRVPS